MTTLISLFPKSWQPYIKMLRLPQQGTVFVVFLFGALDAHFLNPRALVTISLGLVLWSISLFFANDYFDKDDTDKFSKRDRAGVDSKVDSRISLLVWLALTAGSGLLLLSFGLYLQFAILVLSGIAYDMPPFRLKAKFPWDLVTLELQYLVAFTIAALISSQPIPLIQLLALNGYLAVAEVVHLIADREPDRLAGLHNSAATLTYKQLVRLANVCFMIATLGFFYLVYFHQSWWYYILIPFIPYVAHLMGYARGARDDLEKIQSRFNKAYHIAVSLANYLVLYQLGVILYLLKK